MPSFRSFISEANLPRVTADLPVDQRLKQGWAAEDFVITILEAFVGPVQKSAEWEDKGRSKLDGHLTGTKIGQGTVSIQIKCREAGSDILVEWYKAYPHVEGRDRISAAEMYVTMDPARTRLYLLSAAGVKSECEKLFQSWKADGEKPVFRNSVGEMRLQESRDQHGEYKVMAYLRPDALTAHALPGWPVMIRVPSLTTTPPPKLGSGVSSRPAPRPGPALRGGL